MQKVQLMTIADIAEQIKNKELSPVELLDSLFDRINKYEKKLNTYITLMTDIAKQQAKEAEREIMNGNYKGPLHGIPISLKDIVAFAGVPMTNGSRVDPDYIPSRHATVTEKLLKSGAVIIGKAHLHEFAYKGPHPYYGWTKNPWDLNRVPGGSSSGSGSSVQAGLSLASIGTDTGGSIRMPASLCGVVGLKPTYGRVSRYGVSPLSWTLDHVGPLTRTCGDAALVLQSIAGFDGKDESSYKQLNWDISEFNKNASLQGKKIGVPESYIFDSLEKDTANVFKRALESMESAGAEIIPIEIAGLHELRAAQSTILTSEAYSFHMHNLEDKKEGYGPDLRPAFEIGQYYTAESYIQAQRYRTKMMQEFKKLFKEIDIIATPTFPEGAPEIELYEKEVSFWRGKFTFIANILGLPALSLPCGFSKENLPIGLQLIGSPYSEGEVLSIGSAFEQQNGYFNILPDESKWEEQL
ncbi:amidase [Niallia nealsonii]|uniref:Asp-tRNA(Asn)/Glu-tRNA(Gln) amidotransferase subunit GatA n=1 Tax=Niallia nealsonii TaxID=115979 RepID=A0A2N0Z4B9_9BACI|nr:amidase [Niallia nealsonii]PKG24357.1 Asp-tRNA(Asn)/Glu-tRNA(Gln) amidotransferase subunit GatA [Niallia nealsonii]